MNSQWNMSEDSLVKWQLNSHNKLFLTQSWNTKSLRTLWCAQCLIFLYASLETPQALELYGVCSGYWWGFTLTLSLFLGGQPLLDDIYCCIKSAQSTFSLQKKSWKPSYIFQLLTSHLYCPLAHKLLINLSNWKIFERNVL